MKTGILMRAGRQLGSIVSIGALLVATACGQAVQSDPQPELKGIDVGTAALVDANGLNMNGLNMNGLNLNGLNLNGLNLNGLSTTAFSSWFNNTLATAPAVMKYLYGCAAAQGATLAWTNPTTGVRYSWTGVFGLAPNWVAGAPASAVEQQVITACLAAHANYYGRSVPVAIEGYRANGQVIPKVEDEAKIYSVREAAFFGNLFGGGAVYSCRDHGEWSLEYSSARACAFDYSGTTTPTNVCAPIVYVGACSSYCHWESDDLAYDSCTYGGKVYKPITTRIAPDQVFKCGDGVCQFTESCGTGKTFDSCKADCGVCP